RTFLPEEDTNPGAYPVAVLSHRFWSRKYLSDPLIPGRTILLNGIPFTFVGVAPESFVGTGAPAAVPDLWIRRARRSRLAPHQHGRVHLLGGRRLEVTGKQWESERAVPAARLESAVFENRKTRRLSALPATFFDTTTGDFDDFMLVIRL